MMSLRKVLNSSPVLVGAVVIAVAGAALWFSYSRNFTGGTGAVSPNYFTSDDGKSYFAGGTYDYAPIMVDGKEAVRAYLFECDGKVFVGYLERFNKQSRPAMEEAALAAKEKRPPRNLDAIIAANRSGTEVKRPGDKEWTAGAPGPKSEMIRNVQCEDGTLAMPKLR